MKVLDTKVSWMKGWDNSPELQVLVDSIPKLREMVYQQKIIGNKTYFYAQKDGYVNFMVRNKDLTIHEAGYGGMPFKIKISDTEVIEFNGAWSSRAGVINQYFPHCVEIQITNTREAFQKGFTFIGGAVLITVAKDAIAKFCPGIELRKEIRWEDEIYYVPKLKHIANPCRRCKGFGEYKWGREIETCPICKGTGGE